MLPTSLDKDPQSRDDAPVNISKEKKETTNDPIQSLFQSIVSIDCNPPFVVDGSRNSHSYGAGVIVSLDPPLIVCDRDTVPIGISVISITFQNSLTISADLLFLHPFYNFAVLTFDPSPAINAGIKIEAAVLDEKEFKVGDTVNYVGLSGKIQTVYILTLIL